MTSREQDVARTTKALNDMTFSGKREDMDTVAGILRRAHGIEAMAEAMDASTITPAMKAKLLERQESMASYGF